MGVLNPTGYKNKKLNQNYNNAKVMNKDYSWCPSTVRNILKNDIYIGNITQGKRRVKSYKIHKIEQVSEEEWVTVENMHEPIIDKELFEKAQKLRKVDTRVQDSGTLSMWAGILRCKDCGRAMHKKYCKNKSGTVYEYYICGTYRKKSNKLCTKHTLKVEELEKAVLETIKLHIDLLIDADKLLEQINKSNTKKLENENIENVDNTQNEIENNLNETIESNNSNETEQTSNTETQGKSNKERAIEIVMNDWGEDDSVYFDYVERDGKNTVVVRNKNTTYEIVTYIVDLSNGTFEIE